MSVNTRMKGFHWNLVISCFTKSCCNLNIMMYKFKPDQAEISSLPSNCNPCSQLSRRLPTTVTSQTRRSSGSGSSATRALTAASSRCSTWRLSVCPTTWCTPTCPGRCPASGPPPFPRGRRSISGEVLSCYYRAFYSTLTDITGRLKYINIMGIIWVNNVLGNFVYKFHIGNCYGTIIYFYNKHLCEMIMKRTKHLSKESPT